MSLDLDRSMWRRVKFGDVVDRVREARDQESVECYVAGGHFDDGAVEVTRWGDPADGGMGSTFTYGFSPGDTLFVSASWYLRKVGVPTFSGVVADKTYVMRPKSDQVLDARFLPWILISDAFYAFAKRHATGSMNARLLWTTLSTYEFDLPPLADQRRIANLTWRIVDHEKSLATSITASHATFRALLTKYCSPSATDARPLSEVADILDNKRVPLSAEVRSGRPGPVPYYGAAGQVGWIDKEIFNEELVLIGEDGAGLAEWRSKPIAYRIAGPAWVNNHAHVLRAQLTTPAWLHYSLMHYDVSSSLSGGTRPKLTLGSLKDLRIRVSESEPQMLAHIFAAETARSSLEGELEGLRAFRLSVLADVWREGPA